MIHQKPVKEAARQHQKNKDRAESSGANIPAKARKLSDDGLAQLSLVASQLLTSARESRNNSYSTAPTTKPSVQMRKPDDPIVARNIQDVNNAIYRKKFPSQSDDNLPLVVVVGADLSALYGPIVTAQPPTFYGFIKDEIDAALIAEAVVCGERRALQFTPEPSFVRIVHGTVICIESLSLETKDSNMVLIRDGGIQVGKAPRWSAPIQQGNFTIQMELDHSISSPQSTTCARLFPKRNGFCKKSTTVGATDGQIFTIVSYFYPSDVAHFYTGQDRAEIVLRQSVVPLRIPSQMFEFSRMLAKVAHFYARDKPVEICDEFYAKHGHPIYHITKNIAKALVFGDFNRQKRHDGSNHLEDTRRNKKLRIDSLLL